MTRSLPASHPPSAPTRKGISLTSYPCLSRHAARPRYLASFSLLTSSRATPRFSNGTATSTMTIFFRTSSRTTRSGRSCAHSRSTPSTVRFTDTVPGIFKALTSRSNTPS
ncbi:hypothetical protein TKK_0013468 [Trichogramma kaykai]